MPKSKNSSLPVVRGPSHLSESLFIEGEVYCDGVVYINGNIDGTVVSEGELLIGQSGNVKGNIHGNNVIVGGHIEGSMKVDRQLEILKNGHIQGTILVPPGGMMVHQGAVLEGKCQMSSSNI
ncbi:MAG: polymer-forming cytoskeletal protein [SAR324 cluster bacterium]|nr:polymer-forming cytoskeletal protein [SAR324 cluster bacterium]MBF0349625.1 polymer-forming cytoskeletal protein [SAR324 cluster bacterium]